MDTSHITANRKFFLSKGAFPHICTVQKETNTRSASGGNIQTWSDITSLTNIPCLVRDAKVRKRDITSGVASTVVIIIGKRIMITSVSSDIKVGRLIKVSNVLYRITDIVESRTGIYTDCGVELWQK